MPNRPTIPPMKAPPPFVEQKPSVSRDVHYVAYNGICLAGKVIGVNDDGRVDLVIWTNLRNVNGV